MRYKTDCTNHYLLMKTLGWLRKYRVNQSAKKIRKRLLLLKSSQFRPIQVSVDEINNY